MSSEDYLILRGEDGWCVIHSETGTTMADSLSTYGEALEEMFRLLSR